MPEPSHGSDAIECPYPNVSESIGSSARVFREPDGDAVTTRVADGTVCIRFDGCDPGGTVAAGIAFGAPIDGAFRARVRYRIVEWEPRNAIVTFALVAHRPGSRFGCQHSTNIGRHTYARSFGPGGTTEVQCAYGLEGAALSLERGSEGITMRFDDGTSVEELARHDGADGELRLRFRVGIDGASGPVEIEVESIEVEIAN